MHPIKVSLGIFATIQQATSNTSSTASFSFIHHHRTFIKTTQMGSTPTKLIEEKHTGTINAFHSPFLSSKLEENDLDYTKRSTALIVLNSPIDNPPSQIFTRLWDTASFRICADGGANRLYHATISKGASGPEAGVDKSDKENVNRYLPDMIKGDLDSLDDHVREYYERLGVIVEKDGDQDRNDLDKALCAFRDHIQKQKDLGADIPVPQVYIYGAFGGRFDQEMASMQALFRWKDEFDYRVALYNDETFALLLKPNVVNEIYLPFTSKSIAKAQSQDRALTYPGEGPTCGLIPLGTACERVETEGLKWNLDGTVPLEFGGLVSTSNRAEEDVLVIKCSQPLVFTTEMIGDSHKL